MAVDVHAVVGELERGFKAEQRLIREAALRMNGGRLQAMGVGSWGHVLWPLPLHSSPHQVPGRHSDTAALCFNWLTSLSVHENFCSRLCSLRAQSLGSEGQYRTACRVGQRGPGWSRAG